MRQKKLNLTTNINYALCIQFIDRLKKNNKINSGEKLRLKDTIENENGEPKDGNIHLNLKRELKCMKIENGREEIFGNSNEKEYVTNYV